MSRIPLLPAVAAIRSVNPDTLTLIYLTKLFKDCLAVGDTASDLVQRLGSQEKDRSRHHRW